MRNVVYTPMRSAPPRGEELTSGVLIAGRWEIRTDCCAPDRTRLHHAGDFRAF